MESWEDAPQGGPSDIFRDAMKQGRASDKMQDTPAECRYTIYLGLWLSNMIIYTNTVHKLLTLYGDNLPGCVIILPCLPDRMCSFTQTIPYITKSRGELAGIEINEGIGSGETIYHSNLPRCSGTECWDI
jgi:hypothetical protein